MSESLNGKTALVTGGGRRIGREISLELARAGADVVVHVNASKDEGQLVVDEIRAMGRRAALVIADQGSVKEVERACREADAALGPISYLVNNAAIWPHTRLDETTQEDFDLAVSVNMRGPFFWARYLGPPMKARGHGAIVNIADVMAERPLTTCIPYCMAKAGIVSMTYALARALAPSVRVNAIGPGPIAFPTDYPSDSAAADIAKTLARREGEPNHVAHAVRFLCEHDYITGVFLPVDGGFRFGL